MLFYILCTCIWMVYRKSTCSKAYWFMASVYFIYCILIELTNIPYSHKKFGSQHCIQFYFEIDQNPLVLWSLWVFDCLTGTRMRCVRVSDCGINAHKHCKDLVVMECRNKQQSAGNKRPDVVPNGQCSRTYFRRIVSCSGKKL